MATYVESESAYFAALGKFVHCFAMAEAGLHQMYSFALEIPSVMGAAIKGQARAGDLVSTMEAALPHTKHSAGNKAELQEIFRQFNHIADFRNKVLHRGALLGSDMRLTSTNYATRRDMSKLQVAVFDRADIENATADLTHISERLTRVILSMLGTEIPAVLAPISPWRYKQVQLRTVELLIPWPSDGPSVSEQN